MRYILLLLLALVLLSSCPGTESADDGRIDIIASSFPAYDAARAIAGTAADLSMLLPAGTDSHSYEPSVDDAMRIAEADLFIYNGGESDSWIGSILDSLDDVNSFRLVDHVPTVLYESEQGIVEGEEDHGHEHDHAMVDEHVWTSLENEMAIVDSLCMVISSIDPDNAETYRQRADDYISRIAGLRDEFRALADNSERRTIVVADRFPLLYFAREFGLDWFAAYPGCAAQSEPSARTVAAMIDYVNENSIPVILHMELANTMLSSAIAAETGARVLQFNSVHNVSRRDFERGVDYISLMEENLAVLEEALN